MNAREIEQAILNIKDVPGKNDKVDLLKRHLENTSFMTAIQMMLDPRMRFGVAKKGLDKLPPASGSGTFRLNADNLVMRVLSQMADGKLTGGAAHSALEHLSNFLDAPSRSLLDRILLKKPDAGFTASSVNKASPGAVWTFDCMLAHKFEAKRIKSWPVITEPKIDGVRCLIMARPVAGVGWDIGFFSRTGKEFTAFDHMRAPLGELMARAGIDAPMVFDCEIDSGTFNDTVSQARRKDVEALDAVARCFDIISANDWEGGSPTPEYGIRRAMLEHIIGKDEPHNPMFQVLPQWLCHSEDEVMQHNARIQAAGGEGVIVKPVDHLYERKRSYSWLKVKGFETHDLIVTDVFEGQGKYEGQLGGLIVDFNGVDVRVGGGISDEERKLIWASPGDYIGRMIEVGAHEQTPDGSLRHPRLIKWRWDKGGRQDDLPVAAE